MSSILIDTLSYRWRYEDGYFYFGTEGRHKFYHFHADEKALYLRQFLISLLLFDKIYLKIQHIEEFIGLFGVVDAHKLLVSDTIVIIDDGGTSVAFLPNGDSNLLLNFSSVSSLQIDAIQKRLFDYYQSYSDRNLLKAILFKAEVLRVEIDGAWLGHVAEQESLLDLRNRNVTDFLQFQNSYSNVIVKDEDILPISRLLQANRSLVYQNELNIDNLSTEASIQGLVNIKIRPFLSAKTSQPIELFDRILTDKAIPDLTNLYIDKHLLIDDVLSMRDNISGKKFRTWLESINYNKAEVYRQLLSRTRNITDATLTKIIRWAYPNIVGMVEPISGTIVSVVDSFLLDKVLKGWHPNFFLDDILSDKLNVIIKEQKEISRKRLVQKKFGKEIGRNDLCPCKSGKKYKNCCGR
ncbi:SEC-C metal-binding domain-containing protein [Pontibacter roseus]|uniref:SEC-C metal-binding domain-containing protein n=1 Tax=Pontibacter roseus TaxID=336989 RepID=UPI00037CD917|nr:SEC-C metal-binding domain-containing protein [Pontibacter roseus]